jgi:hypothetical protein
MPVLAAVIPDQGTISETVDLAGVTAVVGLIMPNDWTAAVVTVQGSADGAFFHDLIDGFTGNALSFNVRPDSMGMINPNRLRSCAAIKLRSGTRDNPVVQQALREFGLVVEGNVPSQPGTGTSAHVIEDTTNGFHGIEQSFQAPGPMACAITVWLKSDTRQAGLEIFNGDGGARVYFDLAANEIYANSVYGAGFSVFDLAVEGPGPNGWWKCTASNNLTPISAAQTLRIGMDKDKTGSIAYPGDGASFVQVWQPSLTLDGGDNVLLSADDLTNPAWQPRGASVVNFPDDVLPAP